MVAPEAHHRPGELGGPVAAGHERPGAHLHVEHERLGALGNLLRHDRAGDERDRLHSSGHVAERVELAVGGGEAGTGGADDASHPLELCPDLLVGELGPPAGNGLQLVEGAACVAEAPARQLRDGRAAGCHERSQDERHLVADATRRVLVDGRARKSLEVHPVSGADDRARPPRELGDREPAPEDGHEQRGDLLVGDRALDVGADDPVDLGVGEGVGVPFRADDVHHVDPGGHDPFRRVVDVAAAERAGKQLCHRGRRRAGAVVHLEVRPAVLEQELAATSARRQRPAVAGGDADSDEAPASRSHERRDEPALGAECQPVGGVLHVATGDEAAVVGDRGRADLQLRVGGVGAGGGRVGRRPQRRPVDPNVRAGRVLGWHRANATRAIRACRACRPPPAGGHGRQGRTRRRW